MPRFEGPSKRIDTSQGVYVRALATFMWTVLDGIWDDPSPRSRRRKQLIKEHLRLLREAYPAHFVTDTDVEQFLAEEDGDAVQDQDP